MCLGGNYYYQQTTDLFNNTKVIPARFFGQKASGGQVEILLERMTSDVTALAQIRASKAPKPGAIITLANSNTPVRVLGRAGRFFTLEFPAPGISAIAATQGQIPLPPYIKRAPEGLDANRYQTVFAQSEGAVAAPTAGLHFDEPMLAAIDELGIDRAMLTLHVGAGTFQPVQVDDILQHEMHQEWFSVSFRHCKPSASANYKGAPGSGGWYDQRSSAGISGGGRGCSADSGRDSNFYLSRL